MLYLVPTPIGNLEDITLRALRVLREVDLILAEDTRVTKRLLSKYDINTSLTAFHSHNEHKRVDKIVEELSAGKNIALVSDAGSPGISDPGFLLTRAAVAAGVELTSLPGPTALIPAIVMSGIPCDRFHFEGFLPQKKGKLTRIKYLLDLDNPFILYESPHRVIKTLIRIKEVHTEKGQESVIKACVVREISKLHEECIRGTIDEVISALEAKPSVKGEIVIIVDTKA
jgi:16S rRNA (cytidine1402-2'-O)-methyltransferase